MTAITDLSAASSVGATDLLVINQSGTDRKVTADKFVSQASAVTEVLKSVRPWSLSMPNASTHIVGTTSFGVLLVENVNSGAQALIWLGGGANSVASLSVRGAISTTKDTASNVNVYYAAGTGYTIQNSTGGTVTVYYLLLGA